MKPGPAKGSVIAARTGRFGAGAQAAARAAEQVASEPPLPTEPPAWLRPDAQALWRETLPHLVGRATAADAETYAAWCLASANVRALSRSTSKHAREQLNAAMRVALALARDLCLTTVSRARIPSTSQEADPDVREATIASLVR